MQLLHDLRFGLRSLIRNPGLTLVALIIGERLVGIPGLILAPVVLNYLRVEMLTVEVPPPAAEALSANVQAPKKFETSKLGA